MNSTLTTNINFLQQVNWKLTIQNLSSPNVEYFCVAVNLPSVSLPEVPKNYRNQSAYFPGDTIAYDSLTVKFVVDESMTNYAEVYAWLRANANQDPPSKTSPPSRSDMTLSVLTSKNTINREFQFHDAFPVSLSEIAFNTQDTTVQYVTCTAVFRFNHFTVRK